MKYKIGDRVKAKTNIKGKHISSPRLGKIINVSQGLYLIEFDILLSMGHDGLRSTIKGKNGHCWWVEEENIIELKGEK